jgi:hypothetical protein
LIWRMSPRLISVTFMLGDSNRTAPRRQATPSAAARRWDAAPDRGEERRQPDVGRANKPGATGAAPGRFRR